MLLLSTYRTCNQQQRPMPWSSKGGLICMILIVLYTKNSSCLLLGQVGKSVDSREKGRANITDIMKRTGTLKHFYDRYYGRILEEFRDLQGVRILEIDADCGKSLMMWAEYFSSPGAIHAISFRKEEYHGSTIDHKDMACQLYPASCDRKICKSGFSSIHVCSIKIFEGDQSDIGFLESITKDNRYDIIIDDGSHVPQHQIISLARLLPALNPGGLYIIEDLETSYWDAPNARIHGYPILEADIAAGAGYSAVEKLKQLVDVLNRYHLKYPDLSILPEDERMLSITFGQNLAIIKMSTLTDLASKPKISDAPADRARLESWMAAARSSNPTTISSREICEQKLDNEEVIKAGSPTTLTAQVVCHFAALLAREPFDLQLEEALATALEDISVRARGGFPSTLKSCKDNSQEDQTQNFAKSKKTSYSDHVPAFPQVVESIPTFDQNHYAQLLMRTVTGSVYPSSRIGWEDGFPEHPYDFEMRKYGKDWPSVGHTMVGWIRLEQLYNALRSTVIEKVSGDFVELGVWRGGASIFAAGIIKQLNLQRNVWVCDSFEGFEDRPWDGDSTWSKLNPVVAVGLEEVRENFNNYGLLDSNIKFLKGFFSESLPSSNISAISILRLDADLYSSTSDILYNLYERVSIMGFIIVDDWSITQCQAAVADFRDAHNITDPIIQIDDTAIFWRKSSIVYINKSRYEELSGIRLENTNENFQAHPNTSQFECFDSESGVLDAGSGGEKAKDMLQEARDEFWYLSKVSTTALGGPHGSSPGWVPSKDVLVGNNAHINEDIRSHLPGIFIFTLMFGPKSIVELGVRTGWSTRAFLAAARIIGAQMLGIDKDPSSRQVYSNCVHPARCHFLEGDSVISAGSFRDWSMKNGFPTSIDVLFVDTTHIYEDTIQELNVWEPLLSERAAIILHDSNIEIQYALKDGSFGKGWDNERGVARAIQQFVGIDFDESRFFDSGAEPLRTGWRVSHDPTCCGLTILQRATRPTKHLEGIKEEDRIHSDLLEEWVPPACWCDYYQCLCLRSNASETHQVQISMNDAGSCRSDEWEKQIMPVSPDILAGIVHSSKGIVVNNDLVGHVFEYPALIISHPADTDRRKQTEFVLDSTGFRNLIFPRFFSEDEVNIDELISSGQLDATRLETLKETPWVGSRFKKVISLILNHIECLEVGIGLNATLFGVFEDDLMLGLNSVEAAKRISRAISELPPSADVLYLEYCFETCQRLDCSSNFSYIRRAVSPSCTAAMMFTRKGARKSLSKIKRMFLALDNMYAELVSHGDLEAYLATPPIFFQDGYFSNAFKFGERAVFSVTHRPFSIICREQKNDLDMTIIHIDSQKSSKSYLNGFEAHVELISLDSFEPLEWRQFPGWNESTLNYYSLLVDGTIEHLIGSIQTSTIHGLIRLSIKNSSFCFSNLPVCRISVVLINGSGHNLGERTVQLKHRMFPKLFGSQAYLDNNVGNAPHSIDISPMIQTLDQLTQTLENQAKSKTSKYVLNAFVLNVPGDDLRWNRMMKIFDPLKHGIKLVRWSTVPIDDERITSYRPALKELWEKQVFSNQLSFKDAWSYFGGDGADEDWALFMEDDISFHPSIRENPERLLAAIETGLTLGNDDGFVYLGICNGQTGSLGWKKACCPAQGMDFKSILNISCESLEMNGTVFQRGCGSCLHAYAMARWRAKTLYETVVPSENQYGHPESIYLDFNVRMWNSPESRLEVTIPLWVIGSDLISPVNPTHFGICFQDWEDSSQGVQFSGIQYPADEYKKRMLEMGRSLE